MKPVKATFHCHTKWSDGLTTIAEMVKGAEQKGFDLIGISDHFAIHPTLRDLWWTIPEDRMGEYINEIHTASEQVEIKVLTAVEIDYFPGNPRRHELETILKSFPFDYIIGSVHMLGEFPLDDKPDPWLPLSQDEINEKFREYWRAMRLMAESGLFDFAGHLDLPKKFGFLPTVDLNSEIEAAVDAVAAAGMAVEINTSGWDKPCRDGYPDRVILEKCIRRKIPVVINDDAHCPADLGRYYDRAEALLADLGYDNRWFRS